LLAITTVAASEPNIGVLTLHGVGSQHQGSDFDAKLRRTLKETANGRAKVVVKTVYYHGESRRLQAELWRKFDRLEDEDPSSLDEKIIRRLMLASVGDALAYANDPRANRSFYREAQGKLLEAIDALEAEVGDDCSVAVVAHSMGCKVIFDYLCDVQSGQGIWEGKGTPSKFQELANLRLLITTGCNLPFYESGSPTSEQRFFRTSRDFQWINFYDRDDLLGWPLRPLGGRFKELVQDEERNDIGSTLTSHFGYWRNDELNADIADAILKIAHERATNGDS
jgi:hypothetical protein